MNLWRVAQVLAVVAVGNGAFAYAPVGARAGRFLDTSRGCNRCGVPARARASLTMSSYLTTLDQEPPGGAAEGTAMLTVAKERFDQAVDAATSAFPVWVLGAAVLGAKVPKYFGWFKGPSITVGLAATMLCMGMTLKVRDFQAIARRPKPVLVGVAAQYTVMPLLGLVVSRLFRLPPPLAAGVCLVGCCPGGTASNLVSLIAGADVPLSVAMTATSTLLATVVTGPLTKALAGSLAEMSARALMVSTAQVLFVPVALGLALNTYAGSLTKKVAHYTPLLCVALVALICGSVAAQSSALLLSSGLGLIGAVVSMHAGGFALGYGVSKALGFRERVARTTGIEVGMQNSALACVLARGGLPDPVSAVPGALSAACHSVLGSALAAMWRFQDRQRSRRGGQWTRKSWRDAK